MERRSVETIVRALDDAGVRYLVVGGLAVVAHGFLRFTADIDLVLDPDPAAMRRAVEALSGLGYTPRAPVPFVHYADPEARATWVREKGLAVFSVFSPEHRATEIDLFLEPPFDFETVYVRARRFEVGPGATATFVDLPDLLELKRRVGRPQDLQDIAALESVRERGDRT